MEKFEDKKWYVSEKYIVKDYSDPWAKEDRYVEKVKFKMTGPYREYLRQKREEKRKFELMTLRLRLEYQFKTYGEVDEFDFQEYQHKLKEYGY